MLTLAACVQNAKDATGRLAPSNHISTRVLNPQRTLMFTEATLSLEK